MSDLCPENPPEMERLLTKYRGGNVPTLFARDDLKDNGLLFEELLEIFRKAFSATHGVSLYISSVPEDLSPHRDIKESCKFLQLLKQKSAETAISDFGDLNPELCGCYPDAFSSIMHNGKARAFMCHTGMISLAASVRVANKVIAILSIGCRKPKSGAIWNRELFEHRRDKFAPSDASSKAKIDIWEEGKRRIQKCEEVLGLEPGELLKEVTERARMDPKMEISPEELEVVMTAVGKVAEQLSDLAGKNYKLEKDSVIGWLRAEMAGSLSAPDGFWDKIRWCFGNFARFTGMDYILLVSRDKAAASSLQLQCQYGLPQDSLPAIQYDWEGSTARVDDFVKAISDVEDVHGVDLRQYRDVPVLGILYSLYGKGVSYPILVAPTTTIDGRLTCMLMGRKEPAVRSPGEWLKDDDREYLMTIVREISIITNVFSSMKKLQESLDVQTNFLESVSHDLRTPIQNIITAAENLREGRVAPERASRTITGVVTQLQRLDLLAQKAWMLEQLRLDKLIYNDDQPVVLNSVFVECREIMTDMAEMRSMEIIIDPDIRNWKPIHVDPEILRLVVLNLLHNGIKYSFPNTHIRIGGWQDSIGIGVAMTFENEGIPINDEEKDRIFERYFRSNTAVKMSPDGSGVGLALVKEFVDHYKGKIDVRSTEVGFGRYLNVFSIFLPGR